MAEEPPRERLFDVLMRRLEILTPHKAAVRSLTRSAMRNPPLAFALNGLAVQSQQWMLTAADIGASGPRGMVRAQGLAVLFASVLRTWVDDDDPGLARTMAALDHRQRLRLVRRVRRPLRRAPPPSPASARAGVAMRTTRRSPPRNRAVPRPRAGDWGRWDNDVVEMFELPGLILFTFSAT